MGKRVYVEAFATLSFRGVDLDPLSVTEALRLPPDDTHRRGEPRLRRTKSGEVREPFEPWKRGLWSMCSEDWVDSPQVATHIEWMLGQLEGREEQVRELAERVEQARIFCYARGRTEQPPSYPNALDERAERLGLFIDIDYYEVGD